jgi:endonuclease/exonuclease/phosphatase family metal-dependent hydrolase
MRVLTLNLLALEHGDGPGRHAALAADLPGLDADVVALQEVTRTRARDQARDLLGADYTIVDHPGFSDDGVGACLASRWPVEPLGNVSFEALCAPGGLPWAAAVAVRVTAPAPLRQVVIVHHKPSWQLDRERERERQAVTAARFIDEITVDLGDVPVVVLGDFDATPEAASLRFWTGRQSLEGVAVCYESAWEAVHPDELGHTFSPVNPLVRAGEMPLERGRRIDHVLIRCGANGPSLAVADCRLVFDAPRRGVWISDHFGVLADLELPERRPGTTT